MNQIFNVSISGYDVTKRVSNCDITEETSRVYDVASVTIDDSQNIILDSDLIILYGDKTFTGFVYSIRKTGKNSLVLECRTNTAKLTAPYSPIEEAVDEATTSHTLCALYTAKTGIPITNTSVDLDFGGSYERSGTLLSALTNIASVTASEIYDDNGTLIIAPNKAIVGTGVVIPDGDIFNYVSDLKSVYNNGVGFITVQNGGEISDDIISKNKIHCEVDECSGELFVYPNPNGLIESSQGIGPLTHMIMEKKEEYALLDNDVVDLDGSIESIISITLNGADITNYNFEVGHNVIFFNTLIRGTLNVTYETNVYRGYSNIQVVPLGRFINFDLYYLDQALRFQGFLSEDCANTITDGDMTCIRPNSMLYNAGFKIYTIGGSPEFTFYNRNEIITRFVDSNPIDYISVESATLEKVTDGEYRYKSRYPIKNALGVNSSHVDVAYTTEVIDEDHYFKFVDYYPDLLVSYQTDAVSHFVQFDKIDDAYITLVIRNTNTDQVCEFEINAGIPCSLNQDIWVDVASELNMEVTDLYGSTFTVLSPIEVATVLTIDEFGFVSVPVTINGSYIMDTSALKAKTSITLVANV